MKRATGFTSVKHTLGFTSVKHTLGFTLVELLVVIAIISILASIAVPSVSRYIERARFTKAQAEINSIETSLTAMLSDAGLRDFSTGFFTSAVPDPFSGMTIGEAVEIYTDAFYLLLKVGHNAGSPQYPFTGPLSVPDEVRRQLGATYMDELGNDPWGSQYHIFPGPWRTGGGTNPIVFRRYDRDPEAIGEVADDGFTVNYSDPDSGDSYTTGYPAPLTKIFYIFSPGANLVPNQMWTPLYADAGADPDQVGGGDDINNWDITNSFARFYR